MRRSCPAPARRKPGRAQPLLKTPTGIRGLDELTEGGLPRGRPTLLCGGAGCGKTLLAMEFLVRGAVDHGENGVFMAFEETAGELATNFASLGEDIEGLVSRGKIAIDAVHVDCGEIQETGEYDLEGLFIRLGQAIDSVGAKRVVLDTIEVLFTGLSDVAVLRCELRRLFRWLKAKGVTAVVTAERGDADMTRFGLEEYVADCVILLDHRVEGQMATRRLRIVKYRGSSYGTSEYPFLIDEGGVSILPITSMGLTHEAGTGRVSSGLPRLDGMVGGRGYYRGSTVLVTGTAGTGKTSLAAHFASGAVARGERCLWFAFEESSDQILRNMRSIGIDLEPALRSGLLRFHAVRPTVCGLEMHLVTQHRMVERFRPRVVIVDPVSNFSGLGTAAEVRSMLARMIDFMKLAKVTALFTYLASGGTSPDFTDIGISSLMDTWLLLSDVETGAERNRFLRVVKSRGMASSNQLREFLLTDQGVRLRDVYVGPSGLLLAGGAREEVEAREKAQALVLGQATEERMRDLERKRNAMEARVAVLRAEFEIEKEEASERIGQERTRAGVLAGGRSRMGDRRRAGSGAAGAPGTHR